MTPRPRTPGVLPLIALALGLAAAACESRPPGAPSPVPVPEPVTAVGEWRATAVRDVPLPSAVYVFDPDEEGGRTISVHLIADSATLTIRSDGRYTHAIRYTEWEGEVGGPPRTVRARFTHNDFGTWRQDGTSISTESDWLQNHTMTGELGVNSAVLRLQHGLTHGDLPVAFRYVP